ncbi:MAG: GGDEF domain-containing protein [Lachnospiraceae bacterium]|nr:GGDEF domain-containing protein [Lachnospiraceae bacterium]
MDKGKKIRDKSKQNIWLQWSWPIIFLIIVLSVMASRFGTQMTNSAEENVYTTIVTEAEREAVGLGKSIESVKDIGLGAAAILKLAEDPDNTTIANYAKEIRQCSTVIEDVVIANEKGMGICDEGKLINLNKASFYEKSNVVRFYFSENICNDSEKSVVILVPVRDEEGLDYSIFIFCNLSKLEGLLKINQYGSKLSYAITNNRGEVLDTFGDASPFTETDNVLEVLKDSEVSDYTYNQLKVRFNKLNSMAFYATNGEVRKMITVAPLDIYDWELVTVINATNIDSMMDSEMRPARKLFIGLAIAIGMVILLICTISLISKFRFNEQNKNLANKADTDLLTEVNNKMATERKIQQYIDENPDTQCLMFMFDVDNFKKINDTMGHAFGDEVLSTLGHQLQNEFRATDIVGRLGGDEFMVFLKNIRSDEQLEKEGTRINNFFHHFKAGDYVKYSATASIGAAVYPRDGASFHELYLAADKALYEAKRRGKNQLIFYSKELAHVESMRVTDDIDA